MSSQSFQLPQLDFQSWSPNRDSTVSFTDDVLQFFDSQLKGEVK